MRIGKWEISFWPPNISRIFTPNVVVTETDHSSVYKWTDEQKAEMDRMGVDPMMYLVLKTTFNIGKPMIVNSHDNGEIEYKIEGKGPKSIRYISSQEEFIKIFGQSETKEEKDEE